MKAYMSGYESKFAFFTELLAGSITEPIKILEVGAHFGEDTQRFLYALGDKVSKIYCFEPDPRSIEVFEKYMSDDRVILFKVALSNKNGTLPFYQSYNPNETSVPAKYGWIEGNVYKELKLGNSGSSSLKKGYHLTLKKPVHVDTIRYDDWASNNGVHAIDLAWIDVQGAERDVIEGMGLAIEGIKYIWIEFGEMQYEGSMSFTETVELMASKGFSLMGTSATNPVKSSGDALFKFRGTT
jgi:2-O-methyltransferase